MQPTNVDLAIALAMRRPLALITQEKAILALRRSLLIHGEDTALFHRIVVCSSFLGCFLLIYRLQIGIQAYVLDHMLERDHVEEPTPTRLPYLSWVAMWTKVSLTLLQAKA
jgi:hypothetical protein